MIAQSLHRKFIQFPVSRLCSLLAVPRSSFYRPVRRPEPLDTELVEAVESLALRFPGYGYRRIGIELRRAGRAVSDRLVRRIMRERSLIHRIRRRWVATTDSEHGLRCYPHLARGLRTSCLNQLWLSDITYLRLERGFAYLAVVLDAHSRKVVGWSLSNRIDSELALAALGQAIALRRPAPGWIHHSDRGVQYACRGYVNMVEAAGGRISMSSRACPYDNAKAESFFATLKKEAIHLEEYRSITEAQVSLEHYIDEVYNTRRLHSALEYQTPNEFENRSNSSTPTCLT